MESTKLDDDDKVERPRLVRTSTDALLRSAAPPMRWIVPGYVCEGLTVLAGRQKVGKTWLAIDWAIAVAGGTMAMQSLPCETGDVLFVDLENGRRRVRARIAALFPDPAGRPELSRLEWVAEAPPLGKGLIEALEDWRASVPQPRLVVIDGAQRPGWRIGRAESPALADLQRWATHHGLGVIWLHRTRKAREPLTALGGPDGVFGFADATLLLDRDVFDATLEVRCRDGEDSRIALDFIAGAWSIAGEADAEPPRSRERARILEVLETAAEPMKPSDLAAVMGAPVANVRMMLFRMVASGELKKAGHGLYACRDKADRSEMDETARWLYEQYGYIAQSPEAPRRSPAETDAHMATILDPDDLEMWRKLVKVLSEDASI